MAYYQPYPYQNPYQMPSQPQQPQSSGIVWVQGEAAARSYMVPNGASVLLMDSEQSRFYIKATDTSGMPMPLRVFTYTETKPGTPREADGNYVTREEFDKLKSVIEEMRGGAEDAKPPVQRIRKTDSDK